MEDDGVISKLSKRTKKMNIEDEDTKGLDEIEKSFREHYQVETVSRFCKPSKSGKALTCIYTDLFRDQSKVLCGLDYTICKPIDLNAALDSEITVEHQVDRSHAHLSGIRCSKTSPHLFFSSSSSEGSIYRWDLREGPRKPSQKFLTDVAEEQGGTKAKLKPIVSFDVSSQDQLVCAGTEVVNDDSYVLFWDTRASKMLGAYWESHSDDVTAIKFHPEKMHSLATGSTDGLLNVFNLLEPEEDDALLYSFNTNSSVDSVEWMCPVETDDKIVCITHTNEVQVYDCSSGDPVTNISRKLMAEAMMRSNPEAVYVTSCHNMNCGKELNILTNSLSGSGNARLIHLNEEMKPVPRGLFMDQTAVIQTAQYIPKLDKWLTFDEFGLNKMWNASVPGPETKEKRKSIEAVSKREERRSGKRYKPNNKD